MAFQVPDGFQPPTDEQIELRNNVAHLLHSAGFESFILFAVSQSILDMQLTDVTKERTDGLGFSIIACHPAVTIHAIQVAFNSLDRTLKAAVLKELMVAYGYS